MDHLLSREIMDGAFVPASPARQGGYDASFLGRSRHSVGKRKRHKVAVASKLLKQERLAVDRLTFFCYISEVKF